MKLLPLAPLSQNMGTHFITSEVADGPERSTFSADGVAIAHSTPFKSFKRTVTFDKHARQAKAHYIVF